MALRAVHEELRVQRVVVQAPRALRQGQRDLVVASGGRGGRLDRMGEGVGTDETTRSVWDKPNGTVVATPAAGDLLSFALGSAFAVVKRAKRMGDRNCIYKKSPPDGSSSGPITMDF